MLSDSRVLRCILYIQTLLKFISGSKVLITPAVGPPPPVATFLNNLHLHIAGIAPIPRPNNLHAVEVLRDEGAKYISCFDWADVRVNLT